jgi:hypothetical protein
MVGRALADEGLFGEGHLRDRVEPLVTELLDLDVATGAVGTAGAGQRRVGCQPQRHERRRQAGQGVEMSCHGSLRRRSC